MYFELNHNLNRIDATCLLLNKTHYNYEKITKLIESVNESRIILTFNAGPMRINMLKTCVNFINCSYSG